MRVLDGIGMKWLITTRTGADLDRLTARLAAWGCAVDRSQAPIPLAPDEQVIEVDGPRDLPQRVRDDPQIVQVSPSSELTLY